MLLDPNQESMLFQNDHTFSLRMILLNEFTTALKIVGVHIDESLTWEKHIDKITKKMPYAMGAIRKLKDFADRETLVFVYNTLAQPDFEYCCEVWDSPGDSLARRLQRFQNRCARVIMNRRNETGQSEIATQALGWISLA